MNIFEGDGNEIHDVLRAMMDVDDSRSCRPASLLAVLQAYYVTVLMNRYLHALQIQPIMRTYRNVKHILDKVQSDIKDEKTESLANQMWTAEDKIDVPVNAASRNHILDIACALRCLRKFVGTNLARIRDAKVSSTHLASFAAFHSFMQQQSATQYIFIIMSKVDTTLIKLHRSDQGGQTPDALYTMSLLMQDVLQRYNSVLKCSLNEGMFKWEEQGTIRRATQAAVYRTNQIAYHFHPDDDPVVTRNGRAAFQTRRIQSTMETTLRTHHLFDRSKRAVHTLHNGSTLDMLPLGTGIAVSLDAESAEHVFLVGADDRVDTKQFQLRVITGSRSQTAFVSTMQSGGQQAPITRSTFIARPTAIQSLQALPPVSDAVTIWNHTGRLCRPNAADDAELMAFLDACSQDHPAGKLFAHVRLYLIMKHMTSMEGYQIIRQVHNAIAIVYNMGRNKDRSSRHASDWRISYVFCVIYSIMHLKRVRQTLMQHSDRRADEYVWDLMNMKRAIAQTHPLAFLVSAEDMGTLSTSFGSPFCKMALSSASMDAIILSQILSMKEGAWKSALQYIFVARADGRSALFRGIDREKNHTFDSHIASGIAIRLDATTCSESLNAICAKAPSMDAEKKIIPSLKKQCIQVANACYQALQALKVIDPKSTDCLGKVCSKEIRTVDDVADALGMIIGMTDQSKMYEALHELKDLELNVTNPDIIMNRVIGKQLPSFLNSRDPSMVFRVLRSTEVIANGREALFHTVRTFQRYCEAFSLAVHDGAVVDQSIVTFMKERVASILRQQDPTEDFVHTAERLRSMGVNIFDVLLVQEGVERVQSVLQSLRPQKHVHPVLVRSGVVKRTTHGYEWVQGPAFVDAFVMLHVNMLLCHRVFAITFKESEQTMMISISPSTELDSAWRTMTRLTGWALDISTEHATDPRSILEIIDRERKTMFDNLHFSGSNNHNEYVLAASGDPLYTSYLMHEMTKFAYGQYVDERLKKEIFEDGSVENQSTIYNTEYSDYINSKMTELSPYIPCIEFYRERRTEYIHDMQLLYSFVHAGRGARSQQDTQVYVGTDGSRSSTPDGTEQAVLSSKSGPPTTFAPFHEKEWRRNSCYFDCIVYLFVDICRNVSFDDHVDESPPTFEKDVRSAIINCIKGIKQNWGIKKNKMYFEILRECIMDNGKMYAFNEASGVLQTFVYVLQDNIPGVLTSFKCISTQFSFWLSLQDMKPEITTLIKNVIRKNLQREEEGKGADTDPSFSSPSSSAAAGASVPAGSTSVTERVCGDYNLQQCIGAIYAPCMTQPPIKLHSEETATITKLLEWYFSSYLVENIGNYMLFNYAVQLVYEIDGVDVKRTYECGEFTLELVHVVLTSDIHFVNVARHGDGWILIDPYSTQYIRQMTFQSALQSYGKTVALLFRVEKKPDISMWRQLQLPRLFKDMLIGRSRFKEKALRLKFKRWSDNVASIREDLLSTTESAGSDLEVMNRNIIRRLIVIMEKYITTGNLDARQYAITIAEVAEYNRQVKSLRGESSDARELSLPPDSL
jgi:hypothetical protein